MNTWKRHKVNHFIGLVQPLLQSQIQTQYKMSPQYYLENAPTSMATPRSNTHTHTNPPHACNFPAMKWREVVADVKHQFPG